MPERRLPRAQRPSLRAPAAAAASAAGVAAGGIGAVGSAGAKRCGCFGQALPRLLLLPRVPPHRVEVLRPRPVEELPLLLLPVSLALESPRPRRLARRRAARGDTKSLDDAASGRTRGRQSRWRCRVRKRAQGWSSPTLGRSRSKFGLTAVRPRERSDKDSKKAATVLRLVAPELEAQEANLPPWADLEQVWVDGRCEQERV